MGIVYEDWRPVVGHEGKFEVSDQGRVRSLPHEISHWSGRTIARPGKVLTQTGRHDGYRMVSLRDGKKHYVHRLVMAAFDGPADGREVNHLSGNKSDNRLENLEYCDHLHNVRHALATGLQDSRGEASATSKYTTEVILEVHRLVQSGATYAAASRATGVGLSTVEQVAAGKRWSHLNLPIVRRR